MRQSQDVTTLHHGEERPSNHNYIWAAGNRIRSRSPCNPLSTTLLCQLQQEFIPESVIIYSSVTNSQAASNCLRVSKGQLYIYFLSQGLVTTQNMRFIRKNPSREKHIFSFLFTRQSPSPPNIISNGQSSKNLKLQRQVWGLLHIHLILVLVSWQVVEPLSLFPNLLNLCNNSYFIFTTTFYCEMKNDIQIQSVQCWAGEIGQCPAFI